MKSFLVKGKSPIVKWGLIPDNYFFEGNIPEGYKLAVCPSKDMVIIDVDKHGKKDGFTNIPANLMFELKSTFNYPTKNNGRHFWFNYTGTIELANKASNLGIDLRVGPSKDSDGNISNNGGYVVYYPNNDIRDQVHLIKDSSKELNEWLESLFGYVNK